MRGEKSDTEDDDDEIPELVRVESGGDAMSVDAEIGIRLRQTEIGSAVLLQDADREEVLGDLAEKFQGVDIYRLTRSRFARLRAQLGAGYFHVQAAGIYYVDKQRDDWKPRLRNLLREKYADLLLKYEKAGGKRAKKESAIKKAKEEAEKQREEQSQIGGSRGDACERHRVREIEFNPLTIDEMDELDGCIMARHGRPEQWKSAMNKQFPGDSRADPTCEQYLQMLRFKPIELPKSAVEAMARGIGRRGRHPTYALPGQRFEAVLANDDQERQRPVGSVRQIPEEVYLIRPATASVDGDSRTLFLVRRRTATLHPKFAQKNDLEDFLSLAKSLK